MKEKDSENKSDCTIFCGGGVSASIVQNNADQARGQVMMVAKSYTKLNHTKHKMQWHVKYDSKQKTTKQRLCGGEGELDPFVEGGSLNYQPPRRQQLIKNHFFTPKTVNFPK